MEVFLNKSARSWISVRVCVVNYEPGAAALRWDLLHHQAEELLELFRICAATQHHDGLNQAASDRSIYSNPRVSLLVEDHVHGGVPGLPAAALGHPHMHTRLISIDDWGLCYYERRQLLGVLNSFDHETFRVLQVLAVAGLGLGVAHAITQVELA